MHCKVFNRLSLGQCSQTTHCIARKGPDTSWLYWGVFALEHSYISCNNLTRAGSRLAIYKVEYADPDICPRCGWCEDVRVVDWRGDMYLARRGYHARTWDLLAEQRLKRPICKHGIASVHFHFISDCFIHVPLIWDAYDVRTGSSIALTVIVNFISPLWGDMAWIDIPCQSASKRRCGLRRSAMPDWDLQGNIFIKGVKFSVQTFSEGSDA